MTDIKKLSNETLLDLYVSSKALVHRHKQKGGLKLSASYSETKASEYRAEILRRMEKPIDLDTLDEVLNAPDVTPKRGSGCP